MKLKIIVDDLDRVWINGIKAKHVPRTGGSYSGRKSFTDGNIIVKLNDKQKQSQKEIELYKKIESKDKKYFGKVVAYDDSKAGWIAVQKEILKPGRRTEGEREIIFRIISKYDLRDVYVPLATNWSVRRKDNTPFIYDWAL